MFRYLLLTLLVVNLTACGRAGDLYLTKQYQEKHATNDVPVAPSQSLEPLQNNQRVIYSN